MTARNRTLYLLSFAELLAMGLWFSASAVSPALSLEWDLSDSSKAWLTMSVQIGFVVGTFFSAFFNLSDILNARHLFVVSALLGALFNGAIGLFAQGIDSVLTLRFCTGVCLAGVYPPGMKIMATWFREGRGMAIGMLVGALTLGSASPHLLKVAGSPDWRDLMFTASLASVLAAVICLAFVKDGPYQTSGARFDWRAVGRAVADRGVRLANFGYLGHQWELYAVWTWVPVFLFYSFRDSGVADAAGGSALAAFAVIGVGGIGCVAAGVLADRYGRTTITIISLVVSGACCLLVGFLYGGSPLLLLAFCLLWGFVIVADSAQFSASITELAEPAYLGTVLTMQTCVGFLLTMGSIRLIPVFADWIGWPWVFAPLAVGPVLGALSMYRLRQLPEAARILGGTQKMSIEERKSHGSTPPV